MKLVANLLYREGFLVNKYGFKSYRPIGKVSQTLQRLEEIQIDEVILLNKSHSNDPAGDLLVIQDREPGLRRISTPIGYGGGFRTLKEVERLIYSGVERIILSARQVGTALVHEIANRFGEQAIVFHFPFCFEESDLLFRSSDSMLSGNEVLRKLPRDFGGEVIMTSIRAEGTREIDFEELKRLIDKMPTEIAKVYSGGIANISHLEGLARMGLNGVCLGNILNTKEVFVLNAKKSCAAISRPIQDS